METGQRIQSQARPDAEEVTAREPCARLWTCCRVSSVSVSDHCALISTRIARAVFARFAQLNFWRAPGATELSDAAVLVSNHISHFDPFFISLALGVRIDWMTSEEFYSNAIVGA